MSMQKLFTGLHQTGGQEWIHASVNAELIYLFINFPAYSMVHLDQII
jgi:hypothetical protein